MICFIITALSVSVVWSEWSSKSYILTSGRPEVKKGQTCVGTLRSTDRVHPNHELVLVVRKKLVHQTLTGRCDIERPIFLLLGRAPQQAFCRIRKEFVDKHPHLHMSNTCHPSPSQHCQQLCSLFGLGHICDRNQDEHIHNIMHALYKH